ncbi:O-antigen ligase family protein [Noviherbaspirillum saxi]|nr:O-antigen ligase family protein [Noviherbaspirillum saxi]
MKAPAMRHLNTPASKIANWAFLMLFPGFFFYHTALGLRVIPPLLGGFFSPVCIAMAPILCAVYAIGLYREKNAHTGVDQAFFGFLLYFVFIIAVNSVFFDADERVVTSHLVAILHFIVVFIVFKFARFDTGTMRATVLLCWLTMTALIFNLANDGFFYLREQDPGIDHEYVATYQGFGRSYLVMFLVLIPFIKSIPARLSVYLIAVAALFVNGSRSDFAGAILAIAVLELLNAKHKLFVVVLAASCIAFFNMQAADTLGIFPENRTLELLDFSAASSWEGRNVAFAHAIETIVKSPWLGGYGSHFDIGGEGEYAHNILSAWVDLGFIGFAWLVLLLTVPLCALAKRLLSSGPTARSAEPLLPLSLIVVTIFLLCTTKEFTYMLIGAALGAYTQYQQRVRQATCISPTGYTTCRPTQSFS